MHSYPVVCSSPPPYPPLEPSSFGKLVSASSSFISPGQLTISVDQLLSSCSRLCVSDYHDLQKPVIKEIVTDLHNLFEQADCEIMVHAKHMKIRPPNPKCTKSELTSEAPPDISNLGVCLLYTSPSPRDRG